MDVQVSDIHTKLHIMVNRLKNQDLASVVSEEPSTAEEVEEKIDELCISTGITPASSKYYLVNSKYYLAGKFRKCEALNPLKIFIKFWNI